MFKEILGNFKTKFIKESEINNKKKIELKSVHNISFIKMISSGYRCLCPTSIFATALRVISQPFNCNLVESVSCVIPIDSRIFLILLPISFSTILFKKSILCT